MKLGYPRSLFGQVVLLHVATAIVAALTLPFAASLLLHRTAAAFEREGLSRQALAIEAGLSPGGRGGWRVALGPALDGMYREGYDGRAFGVVDANGALLATSARPALAMLRAAPRADHPRMFRAADIDGLSWPVRRAGQALWVIVSQDNSDPEVVIDDVVRSFLERFLVLLIPLLLLVPSFGGLLLRRTTKRIVAASRQASEIGPSNLGARIPLSGLPLEMLPLARSTNSALDRLAEGYRTQSEFVGNVAHELRTPLAILALHIDALPEGGEKRRLAQTAQHASHVVSQLLDLASLERLTIDPGERFDLAALARETVERAAPAVFAGARTIGLAGAQSPVWVAGRGPLISLALANLIDNAVRHTPEGTTIEVAVSAAGCVDVADDGLGLAHADVAKLTRRFWRADQARSDGAGIGLSIVQRIVDVHQGELRIGNRGAAGAQFRICLPPSSLCDPPA